MELFLGPLMVMSAPRDWSPGDQVLLPGGGSHPRPHCRWARPVSGGDSSLASEEELKAQICSDMAGTGWIVSLAHC